MIKLFANLAPWTRKIDFLVTETTPDGKRAYGKTVIMEVKDEAAYIDPTFSLEYENAQFLMDELWNCGLRPSEGTGSAGALAATQKHLEDMRRLVFEKANSK